MVLVILWFFLTVVELLWKWLLVCKMSPQWLWQRSKTICLKVPGSLRCIWSSVSRNLTQLWRLGRKSGSLKGLQGCFFRRSWESEPSDFPRGCLNSPNIVLAGRCRQGRQGKGEAVEKAQVSRKETHKCMAGRYRCPIKTLDSLCGMQWANPHTKSRDCLFQSCTSLGMQWFPSKAGKYKAFPCHSLYNPFTVYLHVCTIP